MPASAATAKGAQRVAQLIETLSMGGAENLAIQIANARAAAGDVSHLFVLTEPGILSTRIAPGVKVRYLNYWRASIRNPFRFLASAWQGYQRVAQQVEADRVALVQTHLPAANFWGLALSLRRRCAVVPTIHNNQEFRYDASDRPWRISLRRRAYRRLLNRCHAMVAVSEEVRQSMLHELKADSATAPRLVVIPNGVVLPEPLAPEQKIRIRSQFGVGASEPLILGAGRLSEQKNFAALVEAAEIIQHQDRAGRVLVAGDGPLRGMLEGMVQQRGLHERVSFLGNVTELPDLMRAADIFVLPSLWEGLPLVLLEALARSLPVVGTDIPGIVTLLEDGPCGLIVPPRDPAALADSIVRLLDQPELGARLGARGRTLIARDYSFERVADQLGQLYHEVLATGPVD